MATRCPNCNQTLREGARFCSACGFHLEKVDLPPSLNGPPPLAQRPDALSPAAPKTPAAASPEDQPQIARRLKGDDPQEDSEQIFCSVCGKPNRKGVGFCRFCGNELSKKSGRTPRNRSRILTVTFLILVILMVCVSLVGIAWGLGIDEWLFSEATPTPELGGILIILS